MTAMARTRTVALTALFAGGLLLTGVGVRVFAQSSSPPMPMQGGGQMPAMPMEGTPGAMMSMMAGQTMAQMHAQLPADLRARMETMHAELPADLRAQMEQMHQAMAGGQMPMGPAVRQVTPTTPDDGDHDGHHALQPGESGER